MTIAKCQLTVQDEDGNVVDGASVQVQREVASLPLVPIYSDREGTSSLGNPFVAADGADAGFYVAGGFYKITATKDGFERIWRDVSVGTAGALDYQPNFLPRGSWSSIVTYALGDFVEWHGSNFVSNVAGNLNHQPVTSPVPASNTYWTLSGRPSIAWISIYDTDRPQSAEQVAKWVAPVGGATFYAGLTDSRADADVAATASAVFSIRKNGVQFATITFAIGATTGTFACAADTAFAVGDVLTIFAPSPRDATLSGVAGTIVGSVTRS